ncbi:MAG: ABC transporter substrate-binding protein, partial [Promethearchaeota archaeon]
KFPVNKTGMLYYKMENYRALYVNSLLWEPLVAINETNHTIPWLAESYDIALDGMTYTFTLRKGMTWHDGTQITPDDVKFSFDYVHNAENPGPLYRLRDIASCTVASDDTITFHMKQYRTWGIYDFLDLKIFPKHVFETVPYNHPSWHDLTNMTTKIGSGPYLFEKVEPIVDHTTLKFVRNPAYWFQGGPKSDTSLNATVVNGGTIPHYPRMDRLTITVIKGLDSTVTALREGKIDTTYYGDVIDLTKAAQPHPDDIYFVSAPSRFRKMLLINNKVSPLVDKVVRQAIAYALDYDEIVRTSESGFALPIYNQYLPKDIFGNWYKPESDIYRYDKLKANQLLDRAGYNDTNGDGIREVHTTTSEESITSNGDGIGFNLIEILVLCFAPILLLTIFPRKHKY